jgi:hypothetical protein
MTAIARSKAVILKKTGILRMLGLTFFQLLVE